jgi:hypothetical protein
VPPGCGFFGREGTEDGVVAGDVVDAVGVLVVGTAEAAVGVFRPTYVGVDGFGSRVVDGDAAAGAAATRAAVGVVSVRVCAM